MRRWVFAAGALVAALAAPPAGAASPSPSADPAARSPLAVDGTIRQADLQHDSRSDLYRVPSGAVPAGSSVVLRLRAAAGDLAAAELHLTDTSSTESSVLPMQVVATDLSGGDHGFDYWQVVVETPPDPTISGYWFVAQDGASHRYITDDPRLDGGTGGIYRQPPEDTGWQLTVHDPAFTTPAWTRGAVVYQVFPDRFANGDPTNDPSPDATPGSEGGTRFQQGDVYGDPILVKGWEDRPEGYCRAYQGVPCDEEPLGRDFFGGDLAGLIDRLDELADRGVTALYLNPVFAAPSNHRYDTTDYFTIDPDLGTQADLEALVAVAHERGIKVILDGVFNHVSSDSPWFDRLGRYPELGACESADSPYRSWFTFRAPGPGEPSPCVPSMPGGDDTYYVSWAGFDTIPALNETPEVRELITGPDGVIRHWLRQGIDGWRLDVADDLSPELMRAIRSAAKAEDPDALVIAEQWHDSSAWLLGDQADSTMDYRFRRAVIGLVAGDTPDLDGSIEGLTPTGFANVMLGMREDYPKPAWDALLHLVDSHDTTRILWTLTPGDENADAKALADGLAVGKHRLRVVATIQMTFPGMASVYYGDEAGLSGQDDPDDRRPYPWGAEDPEVLAWYNDLANLRRDHVALRDGDLAFLLADDATGSLAYLRRTDDEAALVLVHGEDHPRDLVIDVRDRLPDGTVLVDPFDPTAEPLTVVDGHLRVSAQPTEARVWLTAAGSDLAPPAAPVGTTATSGSGQVVLSWDPVDGATRYRVWRSPVTGGGYELVAETVDASHLDTGVHNGVRAFHVVTGLDEIGNESGRSPETMALPRVEVADVRLGSQPTIEWELSAVDPAPVIPVTIELADGSEVDATAGLVVQVGVGPMGSIPAAEDWTWWPGQLDANGIVGTVRPERSGRYSVTARASADGGATWIDGDLGGSADGFQPDQTATLTVLPGPDRQPPPAPEAPILVDVADDHVSIRWPAVTVPDLYRYHVLRADVDPEVFSQVGVTAEPVFTDTTVGAGGSYRYRIVAQDTSFNASPASPVLVAEAGERVVQVTFQVRVPTQTPAADTLFIAGDFQEWAPGATAMTRVDAQTWSITLPFEDGTSIEYKYTRGSWEAVEKDAGCGEIPNRSLAIEHGTSGEQIVEDAVVKWRDVDACG